MILRFLGREGVNVLPVLRSRLSAPMHKIYMKKVICKIRSHTFPVKARSPEITVEGTASS